MIYWQDVAHEIVKWHLGLVEALLRFNFWKKRDYCKMTFIIGRGFAECQILKKWKWPYLLNWVDVFDRLLRKYWYYQDLEQEIVKWLLQNDIYHRSRFYRDPNSEKVTMALSWTEWNSVIKFCLHIDILTRCSPWDCQMTFWIGRGFAEAQILKKVKINS